MRQKELLYERIIRQYEDWELELSLSSKEVEEKKRQFGLSSELSFPSRGLPYSKTIKNEYSGI
ncbi:hypothetical protein ACEQPO_07495 [Bacillus sp. SL00103]